MKRILLAMVALLVIACSEQKAPIAGVAIIPQPLSLVEHENHFELTAETSLVCDAEELAPIVAYVREYLAVGGVENVAPAANYVSLSLDCSLAEEEYRLSVSNDAVRIVGGGYGGVFNGVQTLFQLLPSEVYTKQMSLPAKVLGCDVVDKPKFAYRGFMIDVARTFMTQKNVLRYIDYLCQVGM